MASVRRAARMAAARPVLVSVAPSDDWRDYFDEQEAPPSYWPTDEVEVWLWRRGRAHRRLRTARKLWLAENGTGGL